MVNLPKKKLILRIPLDRPPTKTDRLKRLGLKDFMEKLRQQGWVDENGNALKNFEVANRGHAQDNNHYIEWTARLKE